MPSINTPTRNYISLSTKGINGDNGGSYTVNGTYDFKVKHTALQNNGEEGYVSGTVQSMHLFPTRKIVVLTDGTNIHFPENL